MFDLKTIAERIGGRLDGPSDLRISRLAGIERAVAGDLSYVGSVKFAPFISTTGASALIVAEGVECALPAIRVKDATAAFTLALALFAPKRSELFPAGVHPSAAVDETAELGAGVHVGAQAVVGPGCRVGDRAVIGAGTVLQNGAEVGADSLLYPNVSVQHGCILGERVIVHCGAVIGSDGFGFSRLPDAVHKIPQIGIVRVGNDVEIGANSCIDRATAGETVIADSVKIDNLVQIAHNCEIGERTAISSQTGISGSTTVGRDVIMAGQVGLADHMSVGDGVVFAARAGAHGKIPDKKILAGAPAMNHREWIRMTGHLPRLDRYAREIADLKRRVEELEGESE